MLYMPFMTTPSVETTPSIETIIENFELLDDWEDRYRYLIELGRTLEPLPDAARTNDNKVPGCVSQVWLQTIEQQGRIHFIGDSDAHIVKGLVALLISLLSDRSAKEILEADPLALFRRLSLHEHLTPQRSNGLKSMVERMRHDARQAAAA
jgi:cysteine desulfuration protein SufE